MSRTFFTDRDLGKALPDSLRAAGFAVERFDDHFGPTTADEDWLATVGKRGWTVLTHDERIRYKPTERDAVMKHGVGLILLIGDAPHPALGRNVINSRDSLEAFLDATPVPFIAKLYRPSPGELARNPEAAGRVELWLSHAAWKRRPRG